MQNYITASENYSELDDYFKGTGAKKILLVCGSSIRFLKLNEYFETLEKRTGIKVVKFSDFKPNPDFGSVRKGVRVFRENRCDLIAAVGGGSAMDVAKCIKLFCKADDNTDWLESKIIPNDVEFLSVPTTAGSGSEATRFAVIYKNGEKKSAGDESSLPGTVLFDPDVLKTLPLYQKKSTMMDALCHAVESFWSVASNDESRKFSKEAIDLILENMDAYLAGEKDGNVNMLKAANLAGKAINITQTTAGHAMCYKLTTTYGLAHGHAAALCNCVLIKYMTANTDKCTDKRGEEHLKKTFSALAEIFGLNDAGELAGKFTSIVRKLELAPPEIKPKDLSMLKETVNTDRLKNNPVMLSADVIAELYREIAAVK